ncbi:GH25 family lysozyme [Clostridium sp.]|uniref:GH25 family lysozyme n=1 Tax=Clostridium sp. TaxID=1506 RepID=UPI00260165AA|nr:GH25 family lysozyme [Clostridium sp.]
MKGIDISSYQGNINFQAVKDSGIEIVYIKTSEGMTWQSDTFRNYYNQAKAVGLKVGAYHFLRANAMSSEVDNMISMINGLQFDCKYAIDCEVALNQSKQQITSNVRQFYDIMKSKGLECVLYTYSSFLEENIDYSQLTDIPIWIANYSYDPKVTNEIGFQYSENGAVQGISGDVDLDNFSDGILIGNNSNVIPVTPVNPTPNIQPQPIQSDPNVVKLQQALNRLLNCKLECDGIQGSQTTNAVKQFQGMVRLTQDGIAGSQTWNAINQIFAKPLLKVGSKGIVVEFVQYRTGTNNDGDFGNGTKQAVINYQKAHNLSADGIVGNATWSSLIG